MAKLSPDLGEPRSATSGMVWTLQQEREWHRDLFELAGEGIFLADLDGRYREVNAAGCRLFGYTREELVGKRIEDLIREQDVARLADEKQRLLGGGPLVSEWLLRHKDGTLIPVEVSANILPDGRWLGFVRDLRATKAVAAARLLDEQRLRVALASAPISMFNQDRELRYTWAYNPPAPNSPEHIIGKRQEDLASPETATHLTSLKRQVLATGVSAHTLIAIEPPTGRRWLDLRIEPLRDELGAIVGLTGAAWDVTEHKRLEDTHRLLADASALFSGARSDWQQQLADFARLALRLPCDVCFVDAFDDDRRLRRVGFAHVDRDQAERCAALSTLAVAPDRPDLGVEVMRTSEPLLLDDVPPAYLRASAQGSAHLALLQSLEIRSLIAVPLENRGEVLGKLVFGSSSRRLTRDDFEVAVDLSRRVASAVDAHRLQQALQRTVRARDEALAVVAHDLRNPLNSVLLQSEALASLIEEDINAHRAIDRIRNAARRMNRLIQDLVDAVRLDARQAIPIEIADVAPEQVTADALQSMGTLASASLIELGVEFEPGLPAVRADRDRLLQVFENLIGNAIKFSSRGARVTVRVARRDRDVVFTIVDTGPGIPPEHLAHLFDRFWQSDRLDRRGLGLGLYVVRGIIEAHGGRIAVESTPHHGTSFEFTLPASVATT